VKIGVQSIRNLAKEDSSLSINELRVVIALERAIARLEQDKNLAEHLVFKGGFVLLKHYKSVRFTRDVDALAIAISKQELKDSVERALSNDLDDGLWFGDIKVHDLEEQGKYGSYRFDCAFQIGEPDPAKKHKLSRVHIDIGFSDLLTAKPIHQKMHSILRDNEPISWRIYPKEQVIAEKIQTLYDRGSGSSRAKDIYDILFLFSQCRDHKKLLSAIKNTFKDRKTTLPMSFVEEAKKFDRSILTLAWPGVKVLGDKPDFEEVWKTFLDYLEMLDEVVVD